MIDLVDESDPDADSLLSKDTISSFKFCMKRSANNASTKSSDPTYINIEEIDVATINS